MRIAAAALAVGFIAATAQAFYHEEKPEEEKTETKAAPQEAPRPKRPSALVESVANAPGVKLQAFDYVYPGWVIELGDAGSIVLSYLESCVVETIQGGQVEVGDNASVVEGGTVEKSQAPCEGNQVATTESTQEAAGTAYRVAAFAGQDWAERTIKSDRPIFKWSAPPGSFSALAVISLDLDPPKVIWRGVSDKTHLEYPVDAPKLEVGVPYEVQVSLPGAPPAKTAFSIDPELEGAETTLSRLVPIGP
ncbi:MAG: hypothetical protein QF654_09315 [Alphaproteobacteria bacterium]|nr:hypothetical protein [Alphaproteobacteria bacterium]